MLPTGVEMGKRQRGLRINVLCSTHEIQSTTLGPGHGCGRDASLAHKMPGKCLPDLTFPNCLQLYRGQTDPLVTEGCLSEVYQKGGRRGKGWWVGGVVYFGKFAVNIPFSVCEVWLGTITRLFPLKLSPLFAGSFVQSEVSLNWEFC